ncbi:MAG: MFS transporter [Thermodesulfobacteriota bacterium]|nr:MFS transporter [Thermodesulfobacteriota bacterium]
MDHTSAKTDKTGYIELVRGNAPFRSLWFGQIVSLMGDWLNLIASATLVSSLTESGMAVGALFVVRWLAPFLISPVAGVAADRYDRRNLLILTDLGRGVVVLGFLLVQEAGDVWLLYSLTALQLAMSGFFFPARNAILPNLVSAKELGAANALSSATWSVMLALGTGLGGLVAGGLGVYAAFLIDAFSFFLSALFIARISYHATGEAQKADTSIRDAVGQYVEGLRYLRHRLDILAIVLHKTALALTTSGALHVVQVALAKRIFVIGKEGAISMGIMFAVVGLGTGIGPIMARRYTRDRDPFLRVAIALSFVMTAVGVAIAATLSSFGTVLAGILLRGIGGGVIWVFSTQLLMELVPNHIQGRVFATEFALFTLAGAISAAIGGWSIDDAAVGLAGTLWCMACLCLVPAILWSLCMTRHRGACRAGDSEKAQK